MKLALLVCFGFFSMYLSGSVAADERIPLPLSRNDLMTIAFDSAKSHEALPAGVPSNYDWYKGPRVGAGNNSVGFQAATGWGQVF
jgi:hypothetical protein